MSDLNNVVEIIQVGLKMTTETKPVTSESEEMYLIHIAMAGEEGIEGPVGLSRLAEMLSVSPVSVNQMIKKLATRGLVDYLPYKGVALTAPGREIADQVLRGRRLWALFLAEQLDLSPARADTIACDLEHITPPDLADRLAQLLDNPVRGPQGRPIPHPEQAAGSAPVVALTDLPVGGTGHVVRVEGPAAIRSFLTGEGMTAGVGVRLLAIGGGGDCLLQLDASQLHVAGDLAASVMVSNP